MVNIVLTRKLLRDLWSRKGSLLALIVVSTIGIGAYIGYATTYLDLDAARTRYYRDYRLADFTVDLKRMPDWALDQTAALPNIASLRGRIALSALIDLPGADEPISGKVISMPERRAPVLNDIQMRSGGWFSGNGDKEVILNHEFARANDLRPGSRIKATLLDKQHDLLVVGTAMSPEFVLLVPEGGGFAPDAARFGVMYAPDRFLQDSGDLAGAWNQIIGRAHDASRGALDRALTLIEDRLDAYGVVGTTPVQEQMSPRFLADELKGLKAAATVVPTLFLGVVALALNVLMGRIVVQQRPIIGTLRALGYSRWAIVRHYLAFGAAIGLIAACLGVAMGFLLQYGMLAMYRTVYKLPGVVPSIHPMKLSIGAAIGVGFTLLGTIKGVWNASRLEPAEAMRPPPPEKGGRILLERIPALWTPLSFRAKMVLRAIFRNPYRSAVTVVASLVSTALIVSNLSMLDAMDFMLDYEFNSVSHQDVTVSLRNPVGRRATGELLAMPTMSESEAQLSIGCDLSHGPHRRRIGVTGIPRGNRLYTPLDANRQPIVVPESGLVLTKRVAEILEAGPGDVLRLRPLIAQRKEVDAPVVGIVDTYLGLSAYADLEYLSRLLGEEWSANVLLGRSYRKEASLPFMRAVKERPSVVGIAQRLRALNRLEEEFGGKIGAALAIMVVFSGMIAFGSVLNTAIVSVGERQRDIGSMRVIGYTPAQVTAIFAGESLLLNAVGIAIGLYAGIGLAHLISLAFVTDLYRFPVVIYPQRLAQCALIMMCFILAAQVVIHLMIRGLDWLEALKVKE